MKESPNVSCGTKARYDLLDGLRGVAALLVLWHHVFEGFDFAGGVGFAQFFHGYLAVDFFFILSGFVMGYAYDDRWGQGLTWKNFFQRRLIRLHPMVVIGAVIGCIAFLVGGCLSWDGTSADASATVMAFLCMLLFIPAVPGCHWEVRGNGEMFPLNGPCWSLFFEYIGNIIYALLLRRLSVRGLTTVAVLTGLGLTWVAVTDVVGYGCLGVGWTLDAANFVGGMLRMLFPYTLGLLLSRLFARASTGALSLRPIPLRGSFWICAAALVALFALPHFAATLAAGEIILTGNGIFEMGCILLAFPMIVWLAASGRTTDRASSSVCRFLGEISYPLYVVQYPLMYLFYQWLVSTKQYTLEETWPEAVAVCLGSVLLAYACLRMYDAPLRSWLTKKLQTKK